MNSSTFGALTQGQMRAMVEQMRQHMASPVGGIWSTTHDEVTWQPAGPIIKEENLFKTRFGERKPKHGQRIYRLWIDGKHAGDFKTKAERRAFIEMTKTLMREGP